jgi:signal transduction histidine kinase
MADETRLKQALLNLVTNAVKYNREGGVVHLSCRLTGPETMRILVRDEGPGIPLDKQERVFEPFDRLGVETGTVEGTGIGLTIARILVERMGGKIGLESTPGEGALFWIELNRDPECSA